MKTRFVSLVVFMLMILVACSPAGSADLPPAAPHLTATPSEGHAAAPEPAATGWTMFHADEMHTGVAQGTGSIDPRSGPSVLATYRLFDQPPSSDDMPRLRWTSTLPLGDLDGDGRLEIVVTTPDVAAPTLPRLNGEPIPNMVVALRYRPGDAALQVMWTYELGSAPGEAGLDTYSPALADADGDGLLDVIFTARDGYVRALRGTDGSLIWQYAMGAITEAGPMLGDLNDDGLPEVIVVTDCSRGGPACADNGPARLLVLPLRGQGEVQPLWSLEYPYKMDSAEPVIVPVPGLGKVVLAGTWGGELLAVWRAANGEVRSASLRLRDLGQEIPGENPPVIRTSPLAIASHEGPLVIFGWLPSDLDVTNARLTAVRLRVEADALRLEPAWTIADLDIWKSSPALIPQAQGPGLIVAGYGLGIGPAPTMSGTVGSCQPEYVFGGVAAVDTAGQMVWNQPFGQGEGNPRASAAVADVDGDGRLEVIIPSGCSGNLRAFDALTGEPEWSLPLGPLSQTSPSIADLDGNGSLEIVLAAYDGQVYVIGGR